LALRQIYHSLTRLELERRRTRLPGYKPYPKQRAFHALSATCRERLLLGANQSGKTLCGAAEMAIHLTGLYPDWWEGRRWKRPIRAWAGSETSEVTRDGVQRLLLGEPKDESQWGTGMIPHANIVDTTRRQGLVGALDGVIVNHVSGGNSMLGFKTYDQGRERWQGETLDLVWFDEEPPQDIYIEGLTRTNATEGGAYITATPLKGMSEVIYAFIQEAGTG
jgi:phage terminase large subunit-like protein